MRLLAASLLLPAFLAMPGIAGAQEYSAEYRVSLYGLTLARTAFTSSIDGDCYAINGTIASSGFGAIFDDTKGTVAISGQFVEGAARPDSYLLDYSSGKRKKRTTVRFENGDVTFAENVPPTRTRRHGWVPLEPQNLLRVIDPLSATIVSAKSLSDVCNRNVSIFDGEMRADLALSFSAQIPVVSPTYEGEAVVCSVRFKPIAGYRKGSSTIEYLSAGHDMRVTFVPMGDLPYFVPLRGQVQTKIGTVHFAVTRSGAAG